MEERQASGTKINAREFTRKIRFYLTKFEEAHESGEKLWANQEQQEAVETIGTTSNEAESPMQRMEHDLRPWVAFLIMPVFALANAGINFEPDFFQTLVHPVSLGIIIGLFLGKPIGILLFSWLGIRTKLTALPEGVSWRQMIGLGFLAGIGFTMSIFISTLAFPGIENLVLAKGSILAGSFLAAIVGVIILAKKP